MHSWDSTPENHIQEATLSYECVETYNIINDVALTAIWGMTYNQSQLNFLAIALV